MSNNLSISTVVSPDILKTISSSVAIKTFGDQLVNKAKDKVISVVEGKVGELKKLIEETVKQSVQAGIDHNTELKRLEIIFKNKQITEEQYNAAVAKENEAYKAKIDSLEAQKIKFQEDLTKILSDPYKKLKAEREKLKLKLKKRKTKNKAERAKARRDLAKKMALNAAKTLAPIIALQIAGRLASILSQRGKLEILVDQVNAYIEQANTPETIAIATNLRNNTITLINNSIGKLSSLQKTISQIATYITIFSTIVAILSAIPIPTAVPPGIGIPVNVIIKIVKTLERANKLILALNVVLAISTVVLGNEISKLNDLIERLKTVNQLLDLKSSINLNEQQLADLSNAFLPTGGDFGIYKGFKFAIKEEQTLGAQQAIVVKGNKRRYAVAINRDGTDILRSELSFTLDPNDLIDQLKLIIDQRNLQG
jgi:hypothetical protein